MRNDTKHCGIEILETRRLLTGLAEGQLFLYLLNEARSDPAAYQRAEGLTIDLSGVAKKQPLAWNASLQNSAQFHSAEMATNNYFAHQSAVTGQWPNANVRAHGYNLPSWFPSDNNYLESIGAGTNRTTAKEGLKPLIISETHRNHLLGIDAFNADQREAGIGYARNASSRFTNYWTVHATRTEPSPTFLTGVVFDDLNDNGRYDLNEGSAGIVVTVGASQTVTNEAGGWSLPVTVNQPHAVSVVTASGKVSTKVNVGKENRQVDVRVDSKTIRVDFGGWLNSIDVSPPTAALTASSVNLRHQTNHSIVVTYRDDIALQNSGLRTGNIVVAGPNNFRQAAALVSTQQVGNDWQATYQIQATNGTWTNADDGTYSVQMIANEVTDTSGNAVAEGLLGNFQIAISRAIFVEDTNDDSIVSPVDALIIVNHLNASAPYQRLLDVNRDQLVSPTDVLLVINYLNASGIASAEGEGESEFSPPLVSRTALRDNYFAELDDRQHKRHRGRIAWLGLEDCM